MLAGWGKGTTTTTHCFPHVMQCWLAGAKERPLPHTAFLTWCNVGWLGQRNDHYHTLLSSRSAMLAGWGKGTTTTIHCFPHVVQGWLAGAKERPLPHTAFLTWCNVGWLGRRNDHYHTLLSSRGAMLAGWGKGTNTTTHCFPHVVQCWLAGAKERPLPHTAFLTWCNVGWLGQRNDHYHTLLSSRGAMLDGTQRQSTVELFTSFSV